MGSVLWLKCHRSIPHLTGQEILEVTRRILNLPRSHWGHFDTAKQAVPSAQMLMGFLVRTTVANLLRSILFATSISAPSFKGAMMPLLKLPDGSSKAVMQ